MSNNSFKIPLDDDPYFKEVLLKYKLRKEEEFKITHGVNLSDQEMDYFLQFSEPESAYRDPELCKPAKDEIRNKWKFKKAYALSGINRMRNTFLYSNKISKYKISKDIEERINTIVNESPFKKNRKRRLRFFLAKLHEWDYFIHHLPKEIVKLYDTIYLDFAQNIEKGLTPLPIALMGRWVGSYIPGRIPASKILGEKPTLTYGIIKQYYQIDSAGRFFVLKRDLDDEAIENLETIFIGHLGYRNKNTSKYKFFIDYLIKIGLLTKCVNYSTNCKCNHYRIKWE
ncbi:MAG TPA: hypothetical protein PKI31_15275 [Spirochaetota bacterium]|nr:hypothetical protein [Spirochaetota bacterium]